ncbi:MAG TPA: 4-phosphoerythronate dehydrogenase [Paludibacteraceae bacterium]|nr:4-phosphoerythronate dehydrogenase [Paludibacteraceae bacterium]HQB68505.1 4-phosphoerythronate dehydrogenase [Paludibacteraceae bacterium]HRS67006.1 4-phosphoerythronate dehydrogenase [Paludibacteraceae bacterium]
MTKPTIVIDAHIPFIKGVLEQVAYVHYYPANEITADTVRHADALIVRTRTACNEALLAHSSVRFIATATIGFDHIDTEFCATQGIAWTNAAGCNASSVAQYIGSVLAFWANKNKFTLANKTLGIVGVGHVGTEVVHVAQLLGMRILLNDPPRAQHDKTTDFVSLDLIAREADVITFHTPLTTDGAYPTYNLASADFFDKLQRRPLIINSARGGVVDESALKIALKQGKISDVVLDCWENEPDVDKDLLQITLLSTPHIAGYSSDGKAKATEMSVRAVSRFFGLGLDDYTVTELSPKEIKCLTRHDLSQALLANYNIQADSEQLRANPERFEALRSHYPVRREMDWRVTD